MPRVEKSFEEKLKRWLESEGIYRLGTPAQERIVPMCGYWEKRHGSTYTGGGLPDMHIVVRGISIEAELKAPSGKPSELQIQKINQVDDSDCIGLVLYPKDFDKFQKLVRHLKSYPTADNNLVTYCGLERGWRK